MSVKIRQRGGSPECGVVALFPRTTSRHSGYNAGIGWWRNYFGAGVDGSIGKKGDNNGKTSDWHTVRINAKANGYVDFYLDGRKRYTVRNNKYKRGIVRLGNDCRGFEYKDLEVKQQGAKCSSSSRFVPAYSRCKASSIWANNAMGVSHGRGRLNSPQGWSARYNRKGQWWQMDAGSIKTISGVETQRRRSSGQRVTVSHFFPRALECLRRKS